MPQHDQLHRYLFENFAVRGELVTVSETLQQIDPAGYAAEIHSLMDERRADH